MSTSTHEEMVFADGNMSVVVRVGETVRRTPGTWMPAVHTLLRHLEHRGFPGAPRTRGFDKRGREILTFMDGESIPASLEGYDSDGVLADVARLLRRYHDATRDFVAPRGAPWRFQSGAPTRGEIVCHNDIGPYNTIAAGGVPVAFIDWDFAAPGPPTWDIAHAVWRFAPLYDDVRFGSPVEQGRRLRLFCDAYGLDDRRGMLDTIERRQQVLYDSLTAGAAAGDPGFAALVRDGHGDGVLVDMAYIRRCRAEFVHALS